MDNFHHLLAGAEALQNFLAECFRSDGVGELFDDFEIDVRFEQGNPDFLQRFVNVLRAEAAFTAKILEDFLKPVGQCLKHNSLFSLNSLDSARSSGFGIDIDKDAVETRVLR